MHIQWEITCGHNKIIAKAFATIGIGCAKKNCVATRYMTSKDTREMRRITVKREWRFELAIFVIQIKHFETKVQFARHYFDYIRVLIGSMGRMMG